MFQFYSQNWYHSYFLKLFLMKIPSKRRFNWNLHACTFYQKSIVLSQYMLNITDSNPIEHYSNKNNSAVPGLTWQLANSVANARWVPLLIILYIEKINMQILTINVRWDSFHHKKDQGEQITFSTKAEVCNKRPHFLWS